MSSSPKPSWMKERDAKAKQKKETARYKEESEWKQQRNAMIHRKEQAERDAENAPEFMKKLGALKPKPVVVKRPDDDDPTIEQLDNGTDVPPWHRDDAPEYPDWLKEALAARELQDEVEMDSSDMSTSNHRLDEDDKRPTWMIRAAKVHTNHLQTTTNVHKASLPAEEKMPAWMAQRQKMKEQSSRESSPTLPADSRKNNEAEQPSNRPGDMPWMKNKPLPIVSAEELRKSAVKERVDLQPHLGNKPTPRVSVDELRSSFVKDKIEKRPPLKMERRISFQKQDLHAVKEKLKHCDAPPAKPQWMLHAAEVRKKAREVTASSSTAQQMTAAVRNSKPEWMRKHSQMNLKPEETTTTTDGVTRRRSYHGNDVTAEGGSGSSTSGKSPSSATTGIKSNAPSPPATTIHKPVNVPKAANAAKVTGEAMESPPTQHSKTVSRARSEYIEIPLEDSTTDFIEIPVDETNTTTTDDSTIRRISRGHDPTLATAAEAAIAAAAKDGPRRASHVAEVVEEQIEVVERFSVLMRELLMTAPVERTSSKYGLTVDAVMQYLNMAGLEVTMSPPQNSRHATNAAAAVPSMKALDQQHDNERNSVCYEEIVMEEDNKSSGVYYEEIIADDDEVEYKSRWSGGEYEEIVIENEAAVPQTVSMTSVGKNGIRAQTSDGMDKRLPVHSMSSRNGDDSEQSGSAESGRHERRSKQLGQSLSSFLDEKKQIDTSKRKKKTAKK